MPIKRRIPKIRRGSVLIPITSRVLRALLYGPEAGMFRIDLDVLEAAWGEGRGAVLTEAYTKHNPGEKPWGWWQFDGATATPAERRRFGGSYKIKMRCDSRTYDEIAAGVSMSLWPTPADFSALIARFSGEGDGA